MSTQTESGSPECTHGALWLADDGEWRCELCRPPHFPAEVVERRSAQEVLALFDEEDRTWTELADWPRVNDGTYLKLPRTA